MTAVRWWVKWYARQLAKIDSVQGQLGLFFQGMTGVSVASGVLKFFGAPMWAIGGFVLLLAVLLAGYVHLYSVGGVWNQKQLDKRWLSNNWLGPNAVIVQNVGAKGIVAGIKGRELTDEERDAVEGEILRASSELLEGIDIEDVRDVGD
jgi:hypothetical protein